MVIRGYSENVGIIDVNSKKEYTADNLPIGRLQSISVDGKHYCIMSMNAHHVDDVWYNGRFIGDQYAVFVKVPCSCGALFYQQLTKWYTYYGSAVKRMCKIANVEYRKGGNKTQARHNAGPLFISIQCHMSLQILSKDSTNLRAFPAL